MMAPRWLKPTRRRRSTSTTPQARISSRAPATQFLVDIAANANPFDPQTGALLQPDADNVINDTPPAPGFYDDELLDRHFIAGDGRVNENIGLTAVHDIFHSEHNRLVDQTKGTVLASGDLSFINEWLLTPLAAGATIPTDINDPSLVWNGERLFQTAKFGTEMQYQHLVFEEFARTIHPGIDGFRDYDATMNPAIVAEFAHTVFRFGHSMLDETVDRLDPNFVSSDLGLIQAFLNPLAFDQNGTLTAEQATGAIVRGLTREVGNQIDEFVTEAVRNNLLGLPLDLPVLNITRGRDTGIPSLNAARADFFAHTGDDQLKPYTSWYDYALHLKHPELLVNFIAAYGTHPSIEAATTMADKRAAAMAIVFGGAEAPTDSFDFLHSQGEWASKSASNPTPAHALDADGVDDHGSRQRRFLDRRPGRAEYAVRRNAGLDLRLRFRDPARDLAEQRPALLPVAHPRPDLPHEPGEQYLRRHDHDEHRCDPPAGRRVQDAELYPRARPDEAVQRGPGRCRPHRNQPPHSARHAR